MRLRTRSGLTLLARYTLVSAVLTVGFALASGWMVGREVERTALAEAAAATAQVAESLLGPYLVRGDFAYPLWPGRLDDLDRRIRPHLRSSGVVRVTLWNPGGVPIYSNDRRLIGKRQPPPDELRAALGGRVAARIGPAAAGGQGGPAAPMVEVFVPVRLPGWTAPAGAYGVSRDARDLLAGIGRGRERVWTLVAASTVVLYLSLFGLFGRASSALAEKQDALQQAFEGTIRALATAVDAKDAYTGDHSSQVAAYAEAIARTLGLPAPEVQRVRMGALLHDLGKIGIPDRLLGKTQPLDADEWNTMRRHALIGYQILEPVPIDQRVKLAVRHSHERWDGLGYPDGLRGEQIPIHARVLAVADSFEAMTSDRPYRRSLGAERALEELGRHAGTQFDPRVVQAMVDWMSPGETQAAEAPLLRPSPAPSPQ